MKTTSEILSLKSDYFMTISQKHEFAILPMCSLNPRLHVTNYIIFQRGSAAIFVTAL